MKALLLKAVEALKYHQAQTRPIDKTTEAIADLEAAIREQPGEADTGYEARMRAYMRSRGIPDSVIDANVKIARSVAVAPLKDEGEARWRTVALDLIRQRKGPASSFRIDDLRQFVRDIDAALSGKAQP